MATAAQLVERIKRQTTQMPNGIYGPLTSLPVEIVDSALYEFHSGQIFSGGDCGETLDVNHEGDVIVELPDAPVGNIVTVFHSFRDGNGSITITQDGSDTIGWAGESSNKSLFLSSDTGRRGDYIALFAFGGTSWNVVAVGGFWVLI